MKSRILLVPMGIVALGAGSLAWWRPWASTARTSALYGNVDIREAILAFRVGGRVLEVLVDEGETVPEGAVLARLDPEPLQNALRASEGALAAHRARNALLHRGFRSEDREQAKARLQAARVALDEAERSLNRQEALVPGGASAQSLLDGARSARDQAAAQVRVAEEQVRVQAGGFRPEEIAESDALLSQARAQTDAARLALADATLRAPSQGVILTRTIEKGSLVQAGSPAFGLSLTRPVWVRAYVAEPQLGRFPPGTPVTLHTDSRPGHPYRGVVGFVSPTAEFTPKSVETEDLRTSLVYRLRIGVQDPDEALRQGMPVTVRLLK